MTFAFVPAPLGRRGSAVRKTDTNGRRQVRLGSVFQVSLGVDLMPRTLIAERLTVPLIPGQGIGRPLTLSDIAKTAPNRYARPFMAASHRPVLRGVAA